MRFLAICLLIVVFTYESNSGVLKKLKADLDTLKENTKCGLHKIGNAIFKHDHQNEPCRNDAPTTTESVLEEVTITSIGEGETTTAEAEIDVRWGMRTGAGTEEPLAPTGRRLFVAGSNCPEGQRADARGRCRETF